MRFIGQILMVIAIFISVQVYSEQNQMVIGSPTELFPVFICFDSFLSSDDPDAFMALMVSSQVEGYHRNDNYQFFTPGC